ncbi:MAG TPA: hypothetical protein VKE27_11945 [Candidatus Dormibacteraeota bacterium]|nr:hypothetical protein [Candidatus Dormibacteraeota bacterium]
MRAIRELLKDRRRRQRGSVLSAVLIMTAFIAIIAGALMTELSTNLILSRTLVDRVASQATENSAIEQALSKLQSAPLNGQCPSLPTAALNNVTASASYLRCWPTRRESPNAFAAVGAGGAFQTDGTHAQLNGINDYVVGDAAGNVIDVPFGSLRPRWTAPLGGQVTATPAVIPKPGSPSQVLDVIPLSGSGCVTVPNCLNVRLDTAGSTAAPVLQCIAAGAGGVVPAQPVLSPTQAGLVYYGQGQLLAATDVTSQSGDCDYEATAGIPNDQVVTGGLIAFKCVSSCGKVADEVFAAVGNSLGSQLMRYTYSNGSLSLVSTLTLPWSGVAGLAASGATLPASVAITFAGGGVELVQLGSNGSMTVVGRTAAGAGIGDSPYWCHCPNGDQIGVAAHNGALYVYNSALQTIATYPGDGAAIDTRPGTDAAGDWYVGDRDGFVQEIQVSGAVASKVDAFGPMAQVVTAVEVGGCSTGICIYAGANDKNVYLVPLDARRAIISACVTTSPPTCSAANPRLWANLEVGAAGSPQTVHVEGWSYYSG